MGMPQLIVTAVLVEGRSKSEVAPRVRGVPTVGDHRGPALSRRGRRGSEAAVAATVEQPAQTPREVEDEIVAIRKELDRGGHEAGAATIAFHLGNATAVPPRSPRSGGS